MCGSLRLFFLLQTDFQQNFSNKITMICFGDVYWGAANDCLACGGHCISHKRLCWMIELVPCTAIVRSRVAQWKRAGPITQRSVDRNHALLKYFSPSFPLSSRENWKAVQRDMCTIFCCMFWQIRWKKIILRCHRSMFQLPDCCQPHLVAWPSGLRRWF